MPFLTPNQQRQRITVDKNNCMLDIEAHKTEAVQIVNTAATKKKSTIKAQSPATT